MLSSAIVFRSSSPSAPAMSRRRWTLMDIIDSRLSGYPEMRDPRFGAIIDPRMAIRDDEVESLPPKKKFCSDVRQYHHKPFGFEFIQTTAPQVFGKHYYPQVQATFATDQFVYVFYTNFTDRHDRLQLARMCKITHSWHRMSVLLPAFKRAPCGEQNKITSCSLLWDRRSVLLFADDQIACLDLSQGTSSNIDTSPLVKIEEDLVINVQRRTRVTFPCHIVDAEKHRIFVLVRNVISAEVHRHAIFCLDWDTKQWTKLDVASIEGRLAVTQFMAVWNDQLYLGIEVTRLQRKCPVHDSNIYTYNEVDCIDLTTLDWATHQIQPYKVNGQVVPQLERSTVKWLQMGATVYAIGAMEPFNDPPLATTVVPLNDFWSIHLPTLTWCRHQKFHRLESPMSLYLACVSPENEIWLMKKSPYLLSSLDIVNYRISVSLPELHRMARDAFFYRKPKCLAVQEAAVAICTKHTLHEAEQLLSSIAQQLDIAQTEAILRQNNIPTAVFGFPKRTEFANK